MILGGLTVARSNIALVGFSVAHCHALITSTVTVIFEESAMRPLKVKS